MATRDMSLSVSEETNHIKSNQTPSKKKIAIREAGKLNNKKKSVHKQTFSPLFSGLFLGSVIWHYFQKKRSGRIVEGDESVGFFFINKKVLIYELYLAGLFQILGAQFNWGPQSQALFAYTKGRPCRYAQLQLISKLDDLKI